MARNQAVSFRSQGIFSSRSPGGEQFVAQGDDVGKVQIVEPAPAVVAAAAGVVQSAAQIDHCGVGVGLQVVSDLPGQIVLPHGHLQKAKAL